MTIIPVTKDTLELCTALLGDTPTIHGTPTFVICGDGQAAEQIFAWELEERLPAQRARSARIIIYKER